MKANVEVKVAYLSFAENIGPEIEKGSANEKKKEAGAEILSKTIYHKFKFKAKQKSEASE